LFFCSLSLNVCNIGLQCNLRFLSTTVLQGSVATRVNYGKIFNDLFIANLLLSVMVKEFWRSVRIRQSYGKKSSGTFFSGHGVLLFCMQRLKWQNHKNAAGALYKQQCHISHVCSHSNSNNWHSHVRSSLKDAWNNRVFICRLNAMYDSVVLTDAGRAFQARAAATGNARSPSVVCHVVTM